ncbi:MAG: YdeI/OmpD-associated family protein [Arenicellales bacterium]
MITDIEDFFAKGCGRCDRFATPDCSTRTWDDGLRALRKICVTAGLSETVKWAHPCYTHAGRNIALIGAFRGDFRISFFNAALMRDPEAILEKQGPSTQHPNMIRFTENSAVDTLAPTLHAYLREAMAYAEAGIQPPKDERTVEWPEELVEALDSDSELAEGFHKLTPGRQRSYLINLNSAKKAETRVARISRFRDRILAGKGALER